ncbi:MAG TPA: Calx-beta domain-containing protein [Vicinamibacteria bacterium]
MPLKLFVWAPLLLLSAGTALARMVDAAEDGSELQFGLSAYVASESAGEVVITVRRLGSLEGTARVDYATFDGTAEAPVDYAPLGPVAGALFFPDGAGARSFVVPLVDDTLPEGEETVLLRLSGFVGAVAGPQATAVLTLKDDDPAGRFSVSPSRLRLGEAAGEARLTVKRAGGAVGTVTVAYATADGSARDGSDYTGQAGTLTFSPGQTEQTISIPIAADDLSDGEEYFRFGLKDPTGGAKLSSSSAAIVTIVSNDTAVQFLAPTYSVSEAATEADIVVKRTGSLALALDVSYLASDGTGLTGADYLAASGTLSFPPGVASRSFAVPLVEDDVFRGPRTVNLGLSGPSVGDLGTSQAELTIKDDDPPAPVEFALADFSVSQGAGSATVRIARTGKLAAGQTVELSTANGTAVAGTHYDDSSQTLSFGLGEKLKLVSIPILDDGVPGGGARSVKLGLSSPAGGATLGARGTATLWIVEAE